MAKLIIELDNDKPEFHYYDNRREAREAAKRLRKAGKKVTIK